MKKCISILLLTIIILQTFSWFAIQGEYFLNKNYIATVLCINKNKPMLHCNGKCYLARQLKEQEKQDQQAPEPKKEKFEIQLYSLPHQFSFTSIPRPVKTHYHYTEEFIGSAFIRAIFHPPSV